MCSQAWQIHVSILSYLEKHFPNESFIFSDVLSMNFATETMIVLEEVDVNQEDVDEICKYYKK